MGGKKFFSNILQLKYPDNQFYNPLQLLLPLHLKLQHYSNIYLYCLIGNRIYSTQHFSLWNSTRLNISPGEACIWGSGFLEAMFLQLHQSN